MTRRGQRAADAPPVASSGWKPLDDYRAARRNPGYGAVGGLLQREAILAHCSCRRCLARRAGS